MILLEAGAKQVMIPDWITALVAVLALLLSGYNAYTQRRDRTPRVDLRAVWDLPRDVPQASKGPGSPATADPGEAFFRCEITNVGTAGVKIGEAYVWVDAPPGKPIPLRLPQGEQPRKLDNGDSQTWSAGPFRSDSTGGVPTWVVVLALDTAGNYYRANNPAFAGYSTGPIHPTS